MSERLRITIALTMTILLLATVSAVGLALHAGPPAGHRGAPVLLTRQTAHPTPIPNWHEEQD